MNFEPYTDDYGLRDYRRIPSPAPPRRWTPWLVAVAFVLGFLAGVATVHAAELGAQKKTPVVTLLVRPQVMLQRGDIRVEVRVPPHADNRALAIAWSSDHGTEGSTLRPLEGEDAATLETLTLRSQPPANYLFVATVFGAGGRARGRADARISAVDDRTEQLK